MAMKSSSKRAPEAKKMAKRKWAQWYGTPCSFRSGKGHQKPTTETLMKSITLTAYIKTFASQDPSVSPRPRVTRWVLYWWRGVNVLWSKYLRCSAAARLAIISCAPRTPQIAPDKTPRLLLLGPPMGTPCMAQQKETKTLVFSNFVVDDHNIIFRERGCKHFYSFRYFRGLFIN